MPAATSATEYIDLVRKSRLLAPDALERFLEESSLPAEPGACADAFARAGLLTPFQAKSLLAGKHKGMVLGAYRILTPVGKGGMGIVYLGEHAELRRRVAIKVLSGVAAREPQALERFLREARAVAALDHPNIVRLYDVCHVQGTHFLVMELVEGTDLQAFGANSGPLHYAQAAGYVAQAAAGLAHAHEKGFVHRDVKPANLMLTKNGTIKVLDMGLARSLDNPADNVTQQGEFATVGTADYISPEQALGGTVDARSDVYSLGATLFALVAGHPPYDGSTTQKLTKHQLAPVPDLHRERPDVPWDLSAVVQKMMAKKPADRFATAGEVLDELARFGGSGSFAPLPLPVGGSSARLRVVVDPAPSSLALLIPPAKRPRSMRVAVIAAVVLCAAVGGLALAFAGRGAKPDEPQGKNEPPAPKPEPPKPDAPKVDAPKPDAPKVEVPISVPPAAEKFVYRLDLSSAKVFVQANTGRTTNVPNAPLPHADAPSGWFTHSWVPACTHELFVERTDGRAALGVRVTEGPANGRPEAMLFVRPIKVQPNAKLVLRVEYMGAGSYTPADVRVAPASGEARRGLKVLGKLRTTGDRWETATFKFAALPTDAMQIEFHHYGPLGAGNELLLRAVELREDE
jgi:serine/threonine protein kinase